MTSDEINEKSKIDSIASRTDDFLDLPDCPDFISEPPFIPVWANIKLCEEMLPIWNAKRLKNFQQYIWQESDFYL